CRRIVEVGGQDQVVERLGPGGKGQGEGPARAGLVARDLGQEERNIPRGRYHLVPATVVCELAPQKRLAPEGDNAVSEKRPPEGRSLVPLDEIVDDALLLVIVLGLPHLGGEAPKDARRDVGEVREGRCCGDE